MPNPRVSRRGGSAALAVLFLCLVVPAAAGEAKSPPTKLPYPYVWGKAYYVLPETHNQQSGYFSLCEGLDGQVYVGTARYGENAYLVEFDPRTETQRVVLDTNGVCGLSARGYAAQAKLHTRNFVAPSGRVFVGSKQGYPEKGDTQAYPGGYVMVYDPRLGKAFNLGMPYKTEGVIDVVADEARHILYVVTCEQQHWMRGDLKEDGPAGRGDGAPRVENYRELGPLLARYATTLLAADGCAYALTADFQLARYDPSADKVTVQPIDVDGKRFTCGGPEAIPTWILTEDRTRAYLVLMNDPTLIEIPLAAGEGTVNATAHGKMLNGRHPDSRCALTLHPDGRVYALVREDNQTGFGEGYYLHHLTRFDPRSKRIEDLGVLAVENPEFFPLSRLADKDPPPQCNGYHRLPDGTWTPLHHHMALVAARDGTLYATVLAPFTLLRIDAYKLPETKPSAAAKFLDAALAACDRAEANAGELTKAAEAMADRHLAGGLIGYPFDNTQPLAVEQWGRSGGLIHVGFDRPFSKERSDAAKAMDVALVAYHAAPAGGDVEGLRRLKGKGCYLIGLGPGAMADLAGVVAACDAWLDTTSPGGETAACFSNLVHGWCLTGEFVAALTRRGKMVPVWKSFGYDDGRAWAERYLGKMQFHDDVSVPPVAAGEVTRAYVRQVRHAIRRLKRDEAALVEAGKRVAAEHKAGRKTVVAWSGHLGYGKPNVYARPWSQVVELEPSLDFEVAAYRKAATRGALVLRLGGNGRSAGEVALFREMGQRVMYFSGHHPAGVAPAPDAVVDVGLGYAFGDACVALEGYPIRILPPSGVAQLAAFGAVDAQAAAAE
jgi:hypothetical protein